VAATTAQRAARNPKIVRDRVNEELPVALVAERNHVSPATVFRAVAEHRLHGKEMLAELVDADVEFHLRLEHLELQIARVRKWIDKAPLGR
jgi:hypothetical protein